VKLRRLIRNLCDQAIEFGKKQISQLDTALLLIIPENGPQIFLNEPMKDQRHLLAA